MAAPEFSHSLELGAAMRGIKHFRLTANDAERVAVAVRLGVDAVASLDGELTVSVSKARIIVKGVLKASLARECVASLEPITEIIDEAFDVEFLRQEPADRAVEASEDEWDGADIPPEAHEGDDFDMGEFLVQQLALAMDPFPRKPGAASLAEKYGRIGEISPFAVLQEKFKKRDENQ